MKLTLLKEQLAKSIRNERLITGYNQTEFAKLVEIPKSTYISMEQTGNMSINNYMKILIYLDYEEQFSAFISSLSPDVERSRIERKEVKELVIPLISRSTNKITLDKNVFKGDQFYSVQNGHEYDVSNFIGIIVENPTHENISLLIRYFGIKRLEPYVKRKQDQNLSSIFKKHIAFLEKRKD